MGSHVVETNARCEPNLAKLTIARPIASIVLAVWRAREPYDPKSLGLAAKSG